MSDTVTIRVAAPFVLNNDDGTSRPFPAGLHEVSPETAEHWFVKANSNPVEGKESELNKAALEAEAKRLDDEAAAARQAEADKAIADAEAKKLAAEAAAAKADEALKAAHEAADAPKPDKKRK